MSWQATIWAASLPHSRVGHVPFRVLMLLADHAHDDGTSTWRSVSSIASILEVSERTVHRALRDLKNEVLIKEGDQRLVQHLPPNKRPRVYDLVIPKPGSVQVELSTGVTEMSGVTTGVAAIEEEPPLNTTKELKADHTAHVTPSDEPHPECLTFGHKRNFERTHCQRCGIALHTFTRETAS